MRPRTKKQRQFVEMAGRLPVISEADRAWMMGRFKPQVRLVNLPHAGHAYHCQCCGKVVEYPGRMAEIDKCLPWRCPECGAVCEVVVDRGPRTMSRYTKIETEMYFTKVDVFEGVQVFRQFVASRRNCYGSPTEWEFPELWQNWVLADGSEVITSRPYTRGVAFFNWYDKGEIGIGAHNHHCSGYYEWRDVYDCYGHYIVPRPRYTGLLRRNGYRGWITKARLNVAEAAKAVISDPFAEELAKVGQKALFVEYVKHPHRFRNKEVRAAVRICVRNGYKVRDALLWLDYVDDLVELGKDCRNKVYVCPDNLREAHAWSDRTIRRKREQEQIEERKAEALKRIRTNEIHFAWDRYEDKDIILPRLEMFARVTDLKPQAHKAMVYTLVNFSTNLEQDLERIYTLRDLGYWPYVMVYDREHAPKVYRRLQRWVNMRATFAAVKRFEDYKQ